MSSDEDSISDDRDKEVHIISEDEDMNVNQFSEVQGENEDEENPEQAENDALQDESNKQVVKPKRIIKNPQPKLNVETLKGPRGIASLPSYFEEIKFRGKGHEYQDLYAIMNVYKYWCHRLFPKYPFDTSISRIEKLGKKKELQTHIKRIRFDLLVEDQPIIDSSDEEEVDVNGFVDTTTNQEFDCLLSGFTPSPNPLTSEQLERIKTNRERAEKLREERLKRAQENAQKCLDNMNALPSTSGMHRTDSETHSDSLAMEEDDNEFDLESDLKGKSVIKGFSVKKKSQSNKENWREDTDSINNDENVNTLNQNVEDSPFNNNKDSNFDIAKKKKKRILRFVESDDEDPIPNGDFGFRFKQGNSPETGSSN